MPCFVGFASKHQSRKSSHDPPRSLVSFGDVCTCVSFRSPTLWAGFVRCFNFHSSRRLYSTAIQHGFASKISLLGDAAPNCQSSIKKSSNNTEAGRRLCGDWKQAASADVRKRRDSACRDEAPNRLAEQKDLWVFRPSLVVEVKWNFTERGNLATSRI